MRKYIKKYLLTICLIIFSTNSYSTNYIYNNGLNTGSIPLSLNGSDNLTVTAGNMQSSSGGYTVQTTNAGSGTINITVNSGTTISYNGSGSPILLNGMPTPTGPTVTVNGVVTASSGDAIAIPDPIGNVQATIQITGSTLGNGVINGNINGNWGTAGTTAAVFIDGLFAQVNGFMQQANGDAAMTLTFGNTSPVNFTTNGNITSIRLITLNSGTLTMSAGNSVTDNTAFTINAAGILKVLGSIDVSSGGTFTHGFNNNGTVFISGAGTVTGADFQQAGSLNIANTFNPNIYGTFNNTGGLYVIGSGSIGSNIIVANISGGTNLYYGQDSTTISNPGTFATHGTIDSIPIIQVFSGSTLAVQNAITNVTNVTTGFKVNSGASATLTAGVSGTGIFINSGTTTLSSGGAITTSTFSNTGLLNVNIAFDTTGFSGTTTNSGNVNVNGVTMTVNSSFANNGGLFVYNSGGQISGVLTGTGSLTIGADNTGAAHAITFNAQNTITAHTINVISGSSLATSGANSITEGGGGFNIGTSGTATLNATYSGSGAVTNYGSLNIGNTFTSGLITNHQDIWVINSLASISNSIADGGGTTTFNVGKDSGGTLHDTAFAASNNIASGTINVFASVASSLTTAHALTATTFNILNGGTLTTSLGGTITQNGSGVGSGLFIGTSGSPGGTVTLGDTYTGAGPVTNYGALNIGNTFTSGSIANNSNIYAINSASISGAIAGGAGSSLIVGQNSAGGAAACSFSTSNTIDGVETIHVIHGSFTGANNVTHVKTAFTIDAATSATFNAQISGIGSFTNNNLATLGPSGTFGMTGVLTNAGTFTNNGNMTLAQNIAGTGTLDNNGTLHITANSSMPNQSITGTAGTGTVTIDANTTLSAASYIQGHIHNTTISGPAAANAGIINTTGAIDLTNTQIFVSAPGVSTGGPWTLMTAGANQLTPPASPATQIHLPSTAGLFTQWSYIFDPFTNFIVQLVASSFSNVAVGPINQAIAAVLDNMRNNITNSGQQTLISALLGATTQAQFNQWLQELMPNMNAFAPTVFMQDPIFTRVETRIASLRENCRCCCDDGISAGDINPTTALWIGGFGSFGRQTANQENFGYRSKGFGGILGIDTKQRDDSVFGFGVGWSRTLVHEYSNTNFITGIDGYHVLMYGTNLLKCDRFLEWLLTGAYTHSNGSRQILINNIVMSTKSSYNGGQGAFRLNYGVNLDCGDYFRFTPVSTIQYAAIYQPTYNEQYSPAALHVEPTHYQNVLTLGAGTRLSFPRDDWWLIGTRELRVMGTYDVVSSKNSVNSSFLVGSNAFNIVNPAASRLALKAGVDIGYSIFNHLQLQLTYDYELRSRYTDHSGYIKLKFIF